MKDVKDNEAGVQSLSYEEFLLTETKTSDKDEKIKKKRKRQSHEKVPQKRTKSDNIAQNSSDEKPKNQLKFDILKNSNAKLKTQRLEDVFFKKSKNENNTEKKSGFTKKLTAKQNDTPTNKKRGVSAKTRNKKMTAIKQKTLSKQTNLKETLKNKNKRRKSSDDCLIYVGEVKKTDKAKSLAKNTVKNKLPSTIKAADSKPQFVTKPQAPVCNLPPLENEAILWSEKYEPKCANDIIVGNLTSIEKLTDWLKEWKRRWEKEIQNEQTKKAKENNDSDSDFELENEDKALMRQDETFAKAAAIIGPTGCGKTASIYACAKEFQFKVLEMNASSQRSSKQIVSQLHEATQSHQVAKSNQVSNFFNVVNKEKKIDRNSLILFEDVEILFESDKFFWSGVENLISETKRPIILTTSDRSVLSNLNIKCEKFIFGPAKIDKQCEILKNNGTKENLNSSEDDVKMMIRILGCDIRKSVHALHFWGGESTPSSVKPVEPEVINLIDSSSTSKDESDKKPTKTRRRSKRRSRSRNSFHENDIQSEKSFVPKPQINLESLSSKICGIYDLFSKAKVESSHNSTVSKVESDPVSMTSSDVSKVEEKQISVSITTSEVPESKIKGKSATSDINKFCRMLLKNNDKTEEMMSQWLSSNFPEIIQINWLSLLLPSGSAPVGKSTLNIHVSKSFVAKTSDMEFYGLSVDEDFLASVVQEESNDFLIDEDSVGVSYPVQAGYNSFYPAPVRYYQPAHTNQNCLQPVHTGYYNTQGGSYQYQPVQANHQLYPQNGSYQQQPVYSSFSGSNNPNNPNPFQLVQMRTYMHPPPQTGPFQQQPVHSGFSGSNNPNNPNPFQLVQMRTYMHPPPQTGPFQHQPVQSGFQIANPTQTNPNPFQLAQMRTYMQPAQASPFKQQPVQSGFHTGYIQLQPAQTGPFQQQPVQSGFNAGMPNSTGYNQLPPAKTGPFPQQRIQSGFSAGNPNPTGYNQIQPAQTGLFQQQPGQSGFHAGVPHPTCYNQFQPAPNIAQKTHPNLFCPAQTGYNHYQPMQHHAQPPPLNSNYPVSTGYSPAQIHTSATTVRTLSSKPNQANASKNLSLSSGMAESCGHQLEKTFINLMKPDQTGPQVASSTSNSAQPQNSKSLYTLFQQDKTGSNRSQPAVDNSKEATKATNQKKDKNSNNSSILEVLSSMADACCISDYLTATLSKTSQNSHILKQNLDSTKCKMVDGLLDKSSGFDISHQSVAIATDIQASIQVRSLAKCHEKMMKLLSKNDENKENIVSDNAPQKEENLSSDNIMQNEAFLSLPDDINFRLPFEGKSLRNNQYLRRSLQSQVRGAISATSRAFVADYLPAVRSICRSEDVRRVSKRRFLHYFDTVHIYPNNVEMNKLKNEFKEVVFNAK